MTSSARNDKNDSTQSTPSGPSSSPPLPIKPTKAKTKSIVPTPPHSHETNPKTPDMIQRPDYNEYGANLPPTPGDALSQRAQRMSNPKVPTSHRDETQRIINCLVTRNSTGNILDKLDECVLMELRSSIDHTFTLPSRIDEKSFYEWNRRLSDSGGYEYDAMNEKLAIKTIPSAIHEGVVEVFSRWVMKLSNSGDLRQQGHIKFRTNQGLSHNRQYLEFFIFIF
jgi:hypothetical protein